MATFRDGNNREWHLSVTLASVKRVHEMTGIYLTKLVDDKFAPLAALISDPMKLVDVVYVLVKQQADAAGVSDVQFGESLTGDSVEAMANAFVEALVDFFPSRQSVPMKNLIQKINRVQDALATKAKHEIEAVSDEQLINSVLTGPQ